MPRNDGIGAQTPLVLILSFTPMPSYSHCTELIIELKLMMSLHRTATKSSVTCGPHILHPAAQQLREELHSYRSLDTLSEAEKGPASAPLADLVTNLGERPRNLDSRPESAPNSSFQGAFSATLKVTSLSAQLTYPKYFRTQPLASGTALMKPNATWIRKARNEPEQGNHMMFMFACYILYMYTHVYIYLYKSELDMKLRTCPPATDPRRHG